MQKSYAIKS